MVNKFARLNIQHLGVNTFMYCNVLAVTMHVAMLHVSGYSSYYFTILSNNCRKSWMGPGENFTKTLVWESRVSLTSIYNSESSMNQECPQRSSRTSLARLTQVGSYLLTPWSRVLLEKLTGSASSQEIPRTLWNPKFITVFTSACHLSLS